MALAVVGISHRTAPLDVRARFVVDAQASADALRRLASTGCTEAVLHLQPHRAVHAGAGR
jgi:glutamyl-tRNA reductase